MQLPPVAAGPPGAPGVHAGGYQRKYLQNWQLQLAGRGGKRERKSLLLHKIQQRQTWEGLYEDAAQKMPGIR